MCWIGGERLLDCGAALLDRVNAARDRGGR
jgi:hypothetical protein